MSLNITAVVVAYKSSEVLLECLKALAPSRVRCIVVDNGGDSVHVKVPDQQVDFIQNDRNQGFGRGANQGISAVQTEFALLINPDVVVEEGAIENLMTAAQTYLDAGLLAPKLIEPDGRIFLQSQSSLAGFLTNPLGTKICPEGDCCVPFLSGAALMIRMSAWRQVGGFDSNIFLFYEDDDLCRRFSDHGWSLVHVDQSEVRHARGKSNPASAENTYLRRWHLAWSRGYVANKYGASSGLLIQMVISALKWLIAAVSRNKQRKARYAGTFSGAVAWYMGKSATEKEGLN